MDFSKKTIVFESLEKFDFEQARIKHVLFKSKLRAMLYGVSIDIEPVLSAAHCSLGKWIEEVAVPNLGQWPQVKELDQVHQEMHSIARRLWNLHQAGEEDHALAGLEQIDANAEKLLSILDELEQKVA